MTLVTNQLLNNFKYISVLQEVSRGLVISVTFSMTWKLSHHLTSQHSAPDVELLRLVTILQLDL